MDTPLAEIRGLVEYNRDDERADYLRAVDCGDIERGSESHIFTAIKKIDAWLATAQPDGGLLDPIRKALADLTPQRTGIVVCVRDPDASNDYRTFGCDPEIIDVDLGYHDLRDPEEFRGWAEGHLDTAERLMREGELDAAEYLKNLVAEALENLQS